jgi:hypothetical protein
MWNDHGTGFMSDSADGPPVNRQIHAVLLADYMSMVEPTDKMPSELSPLLFGLFGEVGGVMAASKKLHREGKNYVGFRHAAVDEFGDVLWYLTAIGRRLNIGIDTVFANVVANGFYESAIAANDVAGWPLALAKRAEPTPNLDPSLLKLGKSATALLTLAQETGNARELLSSFAACYIEALQASGMTFGEIANTNATKTIGRFVEPDPLKLPTFDQEFEREERIPERFEIHVTQRKSGKTYLQWNGVFLGDPLTDNIVDQDGYRFHDVFHFAHAAVLHWSPVFRALIKQKRKSNHQVDEAQDGGRAIVIEEGLTAWVFSQAKRVGFFKDRDSIAFDLLKTVQKFVAGYEVDQCPLKLWEHAILQGYRAFLSLRENNGGILVGNRTDRTLIFKRQ